MDGGGDDDAGDDYGPPVVDDCCDYGSPKEESKSVDVHYHHIKEEPEPERRAGDGDAIDVNGYCDYGPPKEEPEPEFVATDVVGGDGGAGDDHAPNISVDTDDYDPLKEEPELQLPAMRSDTVVNRSRVISYDCSHCSASGQPRPTPVRVAVNNKHDLVDFLLRRKFHKLNLDDKLFVHKLMPRPGMKNLIINYKAGNRTFNTSWFDKYEWLTGSERRNKLFCWNCLLFAENTQGPWNSTGYNDLKHLSVSLQKHNQSEEHIYSSLKFKLFSKTNRNVQRAINSAYRENILKHNELVKKNRKTLQRLIDMIIYLATQEQAFSSHESQDSLNRGNFKELANLLSKFDDTFMEFLDESSVFRGLSRSIQNDLIDSINSVVWDVISAEVKDSPCFSWQVDDSTDIACLSQLSVIFRYVKNGQVIERFMGFFDVSAGRKADDLFNLLINKYQEFDVAKKLIAQTYDGASVTSGELNGLQKKIKDVAPQALLVHCYAHRMNLILQDSAAEVKECRIFFANLTGISTFFSKSTKRTRILDEIGSRRVPGSSETWNFKSRVIDTVIKQRQELLDVFEHIVNSQDFAKDHEAIRAAVGFNEILNDFMFLFLLNVFHLIFEQTDLIFNTLQRRLSDISYCQNQMENLRETLKKYRENIFFERSFNDALITVEPPPEKKRKTDNDELTEPKLYFKRVYNEILDLVIDQINVRFEDLENLDFLDLLDKTKFFSYNTKFPHTLLNSLFASYPEFFDKHKLQSELMVWYSDADILGASSKFTDVLQSIHTNNFCTDVPEIYKLLCLVLSLPATPASEESSFSALKRIKTFTRNSRSQTRLHNLATISIEKGLIKYLQEHPEISKFYDKVIDHFASTENRQVELIYKQIS